MGYRYQKLCGLFTIVRIALYANAFHSCFMRHAHTVAHNMYTSLHVLFYFLHLTPIETLNLRFF
jgi:hypothetical protein